VRPPRARSHSPPPRHPCCLICCEDADVVSVGPCDHPQVGVPSTAQHSTAQHSTAQHSTAQHSTAVGCWSRGCKSGGVRVVGGGHALRLHPCSHPIMCPACWVVAGSSCLHPAKPLWLYPQLAPRQWWPMPHLC
jgi:hypothetical protein